MVGELRFSIIHVLRDVFLVMVVIVVVVVVVDGVLNCVGLRP